MHSALLAPKSIAIVGVSRDPEKVGHQIFVNLSHTKADVFPVNPKYKKILGRSCFESLLSIPAAVDLVVIATPSSVVEDVVDEAIDKRVGAVIIIAAGFAETGASGRQLQEKIAHKLAAHNILLLGPNTLGVINPHEKLNASFSPHMLVAGNIALISQSGAMLTTMSSEFESRNVGCSFAISLGNKAGINENDALDLALADKNTKIIALYLESISNAQEFIYKCKIVSETKPVILLKGGDTKAGQQASLSHTAALATDTNLLYHASQQMGFVVVETIEQLFETTMFLDKLTTLPENLLILTNAGGPGVNTTDLASKGGVTLASWSPKSRERLARQLPRVSPNNPTDLLGDASTEDIEHAVVCALEDKNIASLLLIITEQSMTDVPGITDMLIEIYGSKHHPKPLIVALMGGESNHKSLRKLREHEITAVEYSNEAIEIYSYVEHIRRGRLLDRSAGIMRELEEVLENQSSSTHIYKRRQAPIASAELESVFICLENYGFTLPRSAIATSISDLDELDKLDSERVFPLVMKTANLGLKHKALVGGVHLNIQNVEEAKTAYKSLNKFGERVLLQETITKATEVILGAKRDTPFGPFIAIGLGGSLTNVLSDRSYAFLPASTKELQNALRRTKLINGLNTREREQVMLAMEHLSLMFKEHPEIMELEINPLMVTESCAYVADVKIVLA